MTTSLWHAMGLGMLATLFVTAPAFADPAEADGVGKEPTVRVHVPRETRTALVVALGDTPDAWPTVCTAPCDVALPPGGRYRIVRGGEGFAAVHPRWGGR